MIRTLTLPNGRAQGSLFPWPVDTNTVCVAHLKETTCSASESKPGPASWLAGLWFEGIAGLGFRVYCWDGIGASSSIHSFIPCSSDASCSGSCMQNAPLCVLC